MLRAFLRNESGSAVVESAICLPVIFMLAVGTLEAANAIHLRHMLVTAAYETARVSTEPGGTYIDGHASGTASLTARGVTNGTVTITPNFDSSTPSGTLIEVQVAAPVEANMSMPAFFFRNRDVQASVSMVRQ